MNWKQKHAAAQATKAAPVVVEEPEPVEKPKAKAKKA